MEEQEKQDMEEAKKKQERNIWHFCLYKFDEFDPFHKSFLNE